MDSQEYWYGLCFMWWCGDVVVRSYYSTRLTCYGLHLPFLNRGWTHKTTICLSIVHLYTTNKKKCFDGISEYSGSTQILYIYEMEWQQQNWLMWPFCSVLPKRLDRPNEIRSYFVDYYFCFCSINGIPKHLFMSWPKLTSDEDKQQKFNPRHSTVAALVFVADHEEKVCTK